MENEERCKTKYGEMRCLLPNGHDEEMQHTAVNDHGLRRWKTGESPAGADDGKWWGEYWGEDIEAIRKVYWSNQEWDLAHFPNLHHRVGDGSWVKSWAPEIAFRSDRNIKLRKPTEPDYVWNNHYLKDIIAIGTENRALPYDEWFWHEGDIWSVHPGQERVLANMWKPFGGGQSLLKELEHRKLLPPKAPK